jgi:O-antigen ligase
MNYILVLLITSLVVRNTLSIGVLADAVRGLSLVLSGLCGLIMIITGDVPNIIRKYWVILGYIVTMLCSTVFSEDYLYVTFQFTSLVAVFLFGIAYYERNNKNKEIVNDVIFNAVLYLYTLVCAVSLVLAIVDKATAYEILYAGEVRFRGMFPKSGMMGASAGILIGIGFFTKKNVFLRYTAIILGVICIGLTLSRTFWVATFVAVWITSWLYKPRFKKMLFLNLLIVIFAVGIVSAFPGIVNLDSASKITRADSISNLSGRLSLWEEGLAAASKRPFIGYGLTAGSAALEKKSFSLSSNDDLEKSRQRGKKTLHSGYIQSLLDGGGVGAIFYFSIIMVSLKNIYTNDVIRQYPLVFYSLFFLAISNISENVIYAVSVLNSLLFWLLAVFAMSLPKKIDHNSVLS